jgi:hypothetical protein
LATSGGAAPTQLQRERLELVHAGVPARAEAHLVVFVAHGLVGVHRGDDVARAVAFDGHRDHDCEGHPRRGRPPACRQHRREHDARLQHDVNEAEVLAPTDNALQPVLHKIITRTMKVLTWHGALPRDAGFEQALCANMNGPRPARRREPVASGGTPGDDTSDEGTWPASAFPYSGAI